MCVSLLPLERPPCLLSRRARIWVRQSKLFKSNVSSTDSRRRWAVGPPRQAGSSAIMDREYPLGTGDNSEGAWAWAWGSAAESTSSCAGEHEDLRGAGLLPHACPVPHLLGEEKDTEQRQEFRQLILYLKNNKQPDFTYWKREQGKRG